MAFTKVNPKIVDFGGNRVGLTVDRLPVAASQTWKAGQFGIFKSSALNTAVDDEIPTHIFMRDQDTALTVDTLVSAYRIEVGMHLEMYTTNAGSDATVGVANLGVAYDFEVTSNVCTVELGATTDAIFRVVDLAAQYEPHRNATADSPGKCIVEVMKVA